MGKSESSSPVDLYLDPDRFKAERRMMRRFPQAVLASSILSHAGDWWSGDVLDVPLLLSRDDEGQVRAFINVCRHRGARLVEQGQGCGKRKFSCPYHAWTYGCDGQLLHVPHANGFPEAEQDVTGLRALPCVERAGLIWVIVDPAEDKSGEDMAAMLGPFSDDLRTMGFDACQAYAPREIEIACNWKLVIEGSSEAYHFKIAHRQSIAPLFADNAQIIDEHGLNRRMFIVRESLRQFSGTAESLNELRQHGNLLYFFFPLTMILVQPDHAQVTRIEPITPERTRIIDIALIPPGRLDERAREYWDRNVDLYRRTLGEDFSMMESIQTGLRSGANGALRFGRHELALTRFHEQLSAQLAVLDS